MSQYIEMAEMAGATIGMTAGMVTEYLASRHVAQNRQDFSGEASVALQHEAVSGWRRIGATALTPIVFAGAGLGLLNAGAWSGDRVEAQPPRLGIVVDHSGATEMGDSPAIGSINLLTESFNDPQEVEATAYVANSGVVESMEPTEVREDEPFGNAPLNSGFGLAVEKIEEGRRKEIGTNPSASGVLVITNGNTFGNNEDILAQTKDRNIPVFVANVEGETTNPDSVDGFKAIAKETGGQYFDVEQENVTEMVEVIGKSLEESRLKNPVPNDWPKRVIAGALTLATFGLYARKRSRMTVDSNVIGTKS